MKGLFLMSGLAFSVALGGECVGDMVWKTCGTSCPNVCGQEPVKVCNKKCNPGCQCPGDSWLINPNVPHVPGTCFKTKAECPVSLTVPCKGDLTPQTCMSSCPLVCGEPQPQLCDLKCNVGCGCPAGMWRKGKNKCVDKCEAKKPKCPNNMVWNECGTSCPKVCGQPEAEICDLKCNAGCECPDGMWRLGMLTCVDKCEAKKPKCKGDLVFNECGTSCPKVCGQPEAEVCDKKCNAECQCPAGSWRVGKTNKCVPTEDKCDAKKPKCQGDMVWNECGTSCPKVCGQPEAELCDLMCNAECQCPSDTWRVGNTHRCVPTEDKCGLVITSVEDFNTHCQSLPAGECKEKCGMKAKKNKCQAVKSVKCTKLVDQDICLAVGCTTKSKKGEFSKCKGSPENIEKDE